MESLPSFPYIISFPASPFIESFALLPDIISSAIVPVPLEDEPLTIVPIPDKSMAAAYSSDLSAK